MASIKLDLATLAKTIKKLQNEIRILNQRIYTLEGRVEDLVMSEGEDTESVDSILKDPSEDSVDEEDTTIHEDEEDEERYVIVCRDKKKKNLLWWSIENGVSGDCIWKVIKNDAVVFTTAPEARKVIDRMKLPKEYSKPWVAVY